AAAGHPGDWGPASEWAPATGSSGCYGTGGPLQLSRAESAPNLTPSRSAPGAANARGRPPMPGERLSPDEQEQLQRGLAAAGAAPWTQ
ncbi:unnamed protein product, partial [Polarella glacialis]